MGTNDVKLPPLLTVRQVAEYVQFTEDTVRRIYRRGDLKGHKITKGKYGKLRFKRADVLAFAGDAR